MLLSDNGTGFTSKILDGYLAAPGIKHIFGKPYHHTALNNVSPKDVYAGKREEILRKRAIKKNLTLAGRKLCNMKENNVTQP